MIKLKIDHKDIIVEPGMRLIEAARQNGIEIPSLCYRDDLPHFTSCSVCLVKNKNTGKFLHSCSVEVEEGMEIEASSPEVLDLRKDAVSMLLAEHRAECEAPCKVVCPVDLDIPLMNRHIQKGNFSAASALAFQTMGLPETMCALCPEYCENACRRKMIDTSIAIVNIKRFSADYYDVKDIEIKKVVSASAKRIAIIGGSLDGLTAAFFLAQKGHQIVLFEKTDSCGGIAISNVEDSNRAIFNQEVEKLQHVGIEIKYNTLVDDQLLEKAILKDFDTVLIAAASFEANKAKQTETKLIIDGDTFQIDDKLLFKIGKAAKENKQIIRDIAQAKKAALALNLYFERGEIRPSFKIFNSSIGKIEAKEKQSWLMETPQDFHRHKKVISEQESIEEAENCMHCDCRAQSDCQLRAISEAYKLSNPKVKMYSHPIEKKINFESGLIFENAKCIKCGLCVRILQKDSPQAELGFQGRGFKSIISQPLTQEFNAVLKDKVDLLVDICPTAALSKMGKKQ